MTTAFCPQIQRHDVVSLLQVERQVLQDTTCLASQNTWQSEKRLREGHSDNLWCFWAYTFGLSLFWDWPEILSKLRMLFMRAVERMTSSYTGTLPPTSPVLPPWVFTARLRLLQYLQAGTKRIRELKTDTKLTVNQSAKCLLFTWVFEKLPPLTAVSATLHWNLKRRIRQIWFRIMNILPYKLYSVIDLTFHWL